MTTAPRAILYLRLSSITDDSTSIVRQEADLRSHAERQGWEIIDVLTDNGISGRKAREKASEAVRRIADNEADVLAVWKLDRFTRQGWDGLGELSRALDARERAGSPALFVALQDGLTSAQSAFRLIAGVLSEVARTEADNASKRISSSIQYRRLVSNKFAGGSPPFGYRSAPAPDGVGRVLLVDPAEAPVVRDVAARLAEGVESMGSIMRDLDAHGVPTGRAKARRERQLGRDWEGADRGKWTATAIRRIWTSDAVLGRQRHGGDVVRGPDGLPLQVWPQLLDVATVEAVRRRFGTYNGVKVGTEPRRRAARVLSGLVFCSDCGGKMYVFSSTEGRRAGYRCSAGGNYAIVCRNPRISAADLERIVADEFLSVAGKWPEVEEVVASTVAATEAALAEVEVALREASAALTADGADVPALLSRLETLKGRRTELRSTPQTAEVEHRATGRTLAEAWAATECVAWRRTLLAVAMDSVEVSPTPPGGRYMTPNEDRVVIRWRS
ncbi:hypothetical protein GCM10010977_02460 [Citricoccus zhacaiensis]|uniref:Recombinase family protein n=1 Tax=Citricoccus zhacaiensis TaxID=489142 RepID=A0ABQ2LQD1_9MICC|nr:recombinase family protein [Citricoccus zhacaiensis]GGO40335.1 hypothetical protein GCM10010977_02460 [Citricoccus zhacaiensis]